MNKTFTSDSSASIRDVAQLANVSIATVSRVVNGNGYVSEQTAEKVRKSIEQCGFVPNIAARSMRTRKAPIIGFLVGSIRNEYFSDLATNLQRLFMQRGYFVIICATDNVAETEQASIDMLQAQNASGIIMIGSDKITVRLAKDIPTVLIDSLPPDNYTGPIACVESDNRNGGYLATTELIQKGCKNIALFSGPANSYTSRMRSEGYFAALMEAKLPLDLRRVFYFTGYDYANGELLVEQLLASGQPFDGIFAICDYVVQGSLDALEKHHIKVPEDVKVVGFDDLYMAQCSGRKLTTVHQYSDRIAQITFDLLYGMIQGTVLETQNAIVPTYLVRRGTT